MTMDKETEKQAFGHISKVNPDDPSTFEVPSHEAIAEMLPSILSNASTRCPICGVSGVHTHSPAEIVIYRNGVKYGRLLSAWEARGRASGQQISGKSFVEKVTLDVAELADRNSPEDFPEGMIVTADELRVILERHLNGVASGQQGVEGYKLVPVEPTREMLRAANGAPDQYGIYKRMLAASPQITQPMQKAWSEMTHLEREEYNRRAAQPSGSVQEPVLYMSRDGDTCTSELWKVADSRTRDWYCRRLYELPEPPGGT